ncbi:MULTISPECIES: hypothetical protein [Microbacterium]|uniref:Alkaline shock response membrane anchor protein AmaP n=1 Tax=Microbacterium hominis TaxID=162426 RepID=A0A2K9DHP0_9MICO|nr:MULTISPECIES: hypothetical protein [Microbacterium]AUG30489.1 hypothetical protein CXR34_14160 [Microbacterium hominis]
MTLGARILNRAILLLLALVAVAVAVTAAWPVLAGGQAMPLLAPLADAVRSTGLAPRAQAGIAAGILALGVVIALVIVLTRGERHVRAAVDDGGIAIDDGVVADLLRRSLADVPDVLTVSAVTLRRRRGRLVRVRVQVRPRADLALVQRRVSAAVADTDRRLGLALPLVVQLTGGLRSAFAHERRVA